MNLTSPKLFFVLHTSSLFFFQNSRNSDRRANSYETIFAFLDIRKHSSMCYLYRYLQVCYHACHNDIFRM